MTEEKILKNLDFFKETIISLKEEIKNKDEIIAELGSPERAIVEENIEEEIESLNQQLEVIKGIMGSKASDYDSLKEEHNRAETAIINACNIIKDLRMQLSNREEPIMNGTINFLKEESATKDKQLSEAKAEIKDLWKVNEERNAEIESLKNTASENKYSEKDLKDLLKKADKKAKDKISDLQSKLKNFEENYFKLSEKYDNLEISYKSLERQYEESKAKEEIDQVLNGQITGSEIDQVIKEQQKEDEIIKPAEQQLSEMINSLTNKPKIVKMNV